MENGVMEDKVPKLIYVDGDKKDLFKNIDLFKYIDEEDKEKEIEKKDQFIFAMGIGIQNDFKLAHKKAKEWFFRTSSLLPEDEYLIEAVALYDTKDFKILSDKKKVYQIAEQYANGGIQLLNNKIETTPFGSFEKKIEKDLKDIFLSIKSEHESHEISRTSSVDKYLEEGENESTEFKSSLRYDTRTKIVNKELEKTIIKSCVAFLNSEGGSILIGVQDDGSIYGIENDLKTLGRKNKDGFQQRLIALINDNIGKKYIPFIKFKFETIDDKEICIVEILQSDYPAYFKDKDQKKFYIRGASTSQPLDIEEAYEYIKSRWEK